MAGTSAAARVFAIAELVTLIVDWAAKDQDRQHQFSCANLNRSIDVLNDSQETFFKGLALVGRNWTDAAVSKLWASQDLSRLLNVAPSRQQYYANKMRILDICFNPYGDLDLIALDVSTPHLLYLDLSIDTRSGFHAPVQTDESRAHLAEEVDSWIHKFLRPSIVSIQLDKAFSHFAALHQQMAKICTNLTRIVAKPVYCTADGGDMSGMIEVLKSAQKLQSVQFDPDGTHKLHNTQWYPLLGVLAGLPTLRELILPCGFPAEVAQQVHSTCARPFPSLQTLQMECLPATVRPMAPLLSNVTTLWLRILSGPDVREGPLPMAPVASPFTSFKNLKVYHVSFQGNWSSALREDILALGQFEGLHSLEFLSEGTYTSLQNLPTPSLEAPGLSLDLLRRICARNPDLRDLDLYVDHPFALDAALQDIGSTCRLLKTLSMHGSFEFTDLEYSQPVPLFPRLERCEVSQLVGQNCGFDRATEVYRKAMPALRWRIVTREWQSGAERDEFDDELERWFKRRREECREN